MQVLFSAEAQARTHWATSVVAQEKQRVISEGRATNEHAGCQIPCAYTMGSAASHRSQSVMEIIVGRKEENSTVVLDGKSFIDCEFVNCKLIYHANDDIAWTNVKFTNCQIVMAGAAARTQKFLFDTGWKPPQPPGPDHGFSIQPPPQVN
jgi:hypothetical protein